MSAPAGGRHGDHGDHGRQLLLPSSRRRSHLPAHHGRQLLLPSSRRNRLPALWRRLYETLLARYGPQGWWPLTGLAGRPGFDRHGYHPGRCGLPAEPRGRFEVAVGAVLTQNTSWRNVEAALEALRDDGLLVPSSLMACTVRRLATRVRSSGYYRQKARKLKVLARYWSGLTAGRVPERSELLALWGVGPETADSILLYAFHRPLFVIDAYTRRLLVRLGWAEGRESYGELQARFHGWLPPQAPLYQELHALIVRHAKEHCRNEPLCQGCPLAGGLCSWPRPTAVPP